MFLRIADIINDSIVDGPGIRLTVFMQGCKHNCNGCHNPSTHDLDGGRLINICEILNMIDKNVLLDGVTLSGGEPLLQVEALSLLSSEIKKRKLSTILYTGYTWEEIIENISQYEKLLKNLDYLIDGPFIKSLKSLELNFKGSTNQRIIDVKSSFENNKIVEYEFL